MKRCAIKLLTNLKVSSYETVPAGTIWEGTVDSLPDFIQSMVREKSRSIAVRELPEEVKVPELPDIPEGTDELPDGSDEGPEGVETPDEVTETTAVSEPEPEPKPEPTKKPSRKPIKK